MSRPKFSVVLIARNEQSTLPRMLESLEEFRRRGGEVLVVDTGSMDGTADVASAHECRVIEVGDRFVTVVSEAKAKQVNRRLLAPGEPPVLHAGDRLFDFAAARNFAASEAECDMVAMPDCDEAFTKLDLDAVDEAIDAGARRLEYNFVFSHDQFGNEAIKFLHSKFYDRRSFEWVGVVHEVLQPRSGGSSLDDPFKTVFLDESKVKLEHWQNHGTDRGGYLRGLALDCYENPGNDRNSHYLGRELLWKGRPKSAIQELTRHLGMKAWPAEQAQSMIYIGDAYLQLGKEQLGLQMYHKAFLLDGSRREAMMRLAEHFYKKGNALMTAAYASAALALPYNGFYANNMDHYRQAPHEMLYWAYWNMGDRGESEVHWRRALGYQPLNPKYLNAAQFYQHPEPALRSLEAAVGSGTPFSFVKFGDGEELCMRGAEGANCDGQTYSRELGDRLRESLTFLAGRPGVTVAHYADQRLVNLLLHREGSDNAAVKGFWTSIRRAAAGGDRRTLVVGPDRLGGLASLLKAAQHVRVPERDAFSEYERVRAELLKALRLRPQETVVVLSAGPMAKVLAADALKVYPACTCVDAGSSFDSLFTGQTTRTSQLDHDSMARLYAAELEEDGMPLVSICVPVLGRPQQTANLMRDIALNANYPAYEVVVEEDSFEDRQGCPKTLKKAVERSTGKLVMFLGNDCTPEPNFLQSAVLQFQAHFAGGRFAGRVGEGHVAPLEGVGLVALNDGYWDPSSIATHWLASKSLLPYLDGEFFHTGYRHVGCDNELTARCKALGLYFWAKGSRLTHHHPTALGWDSMDDVHRLAYSHESLVHDRALLASRLEMLGLKHEEPRRLGQ